MIDILQILDTFLLQMLQVKGKKPFVKDVKH